MPESKQTAEALAKSLIAPAGGDAPADAEAILFGTSEPPVFPDNNIFPIEWVVETPRLVDIYEQARDPGCLPCLPKKINRSLVTGHWLLVTGY